MFNALQVAILVLFFLDAIREMQKYGSEEELQKTMGTATQLDSQMQMHMRLFRAQRNFYIAGLVEIISRIICTKQYIGLLSSYFW